MCFSSGLAVATGEKCPVMAIASSPAAPSKGHRSAGVPTIALKKRRMLLSRAPPLTSHSMRLAHL
jgi:hypothetical protein